MAERKTRKKVRIVSQYQTTFNSPSGKAVLCDLAKSCFVTLSTIHADPLQMAFNEGQRNVVLKIQHILKIDHESLMAEINRQDELEE